MGNFGELSIGKFREVGGALSVPRGEPHFLAAMIAGLNFYSIPIECR